MTTQESARPRARICTPRSRTAAAIQPNLSHRYGTIGIQAVAAAARYSDHRKSPAMRRSMRRLPACASISASWSRQTSRDHH